MEESLSIDIRSTAMTDINRQETLKREDFARHLSKLVQHNGSINRSNQPPIEHS